MAITATTRTHFTCDTELERLSLEDVVLSEGMTVTVKTTPVKMYIYTGGNWYTVGGTPNLIVSETEPSAPFDGLVWIEKTP